MPVHWILGKVAQVSDPDEPVIMSGGISDMAMTDEIIVEMNGEVQPKPEHHTGTLNLSGEGNA